ncbi:MAG: hypothetical protein M1829_003781 [Trizodia sp. TS-e1964]|nr:MAG: hypothetical protein M1829_003781 [Trizodia sp. TS-e1964]
MSFLQRPLAGPGYVILNILRVLNITALASVIVASWVMLVKTFVVSKFFFFDACGHAVTSSISMFLIVTELPLCRNYIEQNWPLFSPVSGFIALGASMTVVGINTLGHLNKEATSEESLGLGFWRIVIASGILAFILGIFNIIASLLFSDPRNGVTARAVRAKGAVALPNSSRTGSNYAPSRSNSSSTSYNKPQNTQGRYSIRRSLHNLQNFFQGTSSSPTIPSYISHSTKTVPTYDLNRHPSERTPHIRPLSRGRSIHSRNGSGGGNASQRGYSPSQYSQSQYGQFSFPSSLPPSRPSSVRRPLNPKMPLKISSPVSVNKAQFSKFAGSDPIVRPDQVYSAMHPSYTRDCE